MNCGPPFVGRSVANSSSRCHRTRSSFAPAGQDNYSLAILSLLLSSVGALPLERAGNYAAEGFALNGAKTDCCYKHPAPAERKQNTIAIQTCVHQLLRFIHRSRYEI